MNVSYVVDRGFTAMAVPERRPGARIGAADVVAPAETGMQDGRLGAICCVSVGGVAR
jgi:hypothetical protein